MVIFNQVFGKGEGKTSDTLFRIIVGGLKSLINRNAPWRCQKDFPLRRLALRRRDLPPPPSDRWPERPLRLGPSVPGGQSTQSVAPVWFTKRPELHLVHEVEAFDGWCSPLLHKMQTVAAVSE